MTSDIADFDLGIFAIKKLNPRLYYKSFISNGIRPDGRGFRTRRKIISSLGEIKKSETIIGSCILSLGYTRLSAVVTYQIGVPSIDEPLFGSLDFEIQLGAIASIKYEDKYNSDESLTIAQYLKSVIIKSKCIDLSQLCIEEGSLVYQLTCHLTFISTDGNLKDAALLATLLALKDVRLPEIIPDQTDSSQSSSSSSSTNITENRDRQSRSIPFRFYPIPMSIGIFMDHILFDLTEEEEGTEGETEVRRMMDSRFNFVVSVHENRIIYSETHVKDSIITIERLEQIHSLIMDEANNLARSIGIR